MQETPVHHPPAGDTIAAIATPPGRGGVGIVRVSGAHLSPLLAAITGGKNVPPRRAVYATFHDAQRQVIDQGLALYFPAPHSYTGEDVVELHGHGSPAALRALLARCVELGARLAEPGEFTRRAFLNDKLDLAEAEAVADLIDAATGAAARAAARSLSGAFSAEVDALVEALIETRMHIEASFDFPEEDLDGVLDTAIAARIAALTDTLQALIARARAGALLREGLTIVLIGAPNVGKSSLLNRLAREEAAIVTPVPGTTRDTIERQIALAGIPLTIVDTAGLRDTDDAIEKIGIERTWAAIARADLALFLSDARQAANALPAEDVALLARLPETMPRILVYNKSDLLETPRAALPAPASATTPATTPHAPSSARTVFLSAKTGEGLAALEDAVLDAIGVAHLTEDTFLARERHLTALQKASTHLHAAQQEMNAAIPALELAAEQLRLTQEALSSITGAFAADDLLGVIFSRFCIGK